MLQSMRLQRRCPGGASAPDRSDWACWCETMLQSAHGDECISKLGLAVIGVFDDIGSRSSHYRRQDLLGGHRRRGAQEQCCCARHMGGMPLRCCCTSCCRCRPWRQQKAHRGQDPDLGAIAVAAEDGMLVGGVCGTQIEGVVRFLATCGKNLCSHFLML